MKNSLFETDDRENECNLPADLIQLAKARNQRAVDDLFGYIIKECPDCFKAYNN